MDIKIPPCCPFNTLGFQQASITWRDIVPKKVKVLGSKIDQMFLESNKLNKRSLALWKKSLKLRKKAGLLLTDFMLKDKKIKKSNSHELYGEI